ncbi:PucR family transcriptional regulator [Pseudomonas parafulva]|uniref:PucR family transcriptional regulator n=2 Tax=Pseudomonas parafulva TaxID=157782 RepID=A0AAI8KFP7_9PSED|nr:PucR family transcriptional regulator [Pseudomonas parafulva]
MNLASAWLSTHFQSTQVIMSVMTPAISRELKAKIRHFVENPAELADRILARLIQGNSDYAKLADEAKRDAWESIRTYSSLWFRCLYEGRTINSQEIEQLTQSGRRRFHQGIGLNSLLRVFRAGSQEMLDAYLQIGVDDPGLRDELLFTLSPSLLEYVDSLSLAIAHAYLQEQFQGARWRDARRYELSSIVFNHDPDPEGFQRVCSALGLDAEGLWLAIALALDFQVTHPGDLEMEAERLVAQVASHFNTTSGHLTYVMRHGRLIIWLPRARGESLLLSDRLMRDRMQAFPLANTPIRHIGIGLINQGVAGWAASASEALKAIETGTVAWPQMRVHSYSNVAISESIKSSRPALRYLDSIIESLGNEPELIATLDCFFEHSEKHKITAAALNIHPNTLAYRLDRIMSLLGGRTSDLDFMVSLRLAMALRRESHRLDLDRR